MSEFVLSGINNGSMFIPVFDSGNSMFDEFQWLVGVAFISYHRRPCGLAVAAVANKRRNLSNAPTGGNSEQQIATITVATTCHAVAMKSDESSNNNNEVAAVATVKRKRQ
jgi:hypothetical protein